MFKLRERNEGETSGQEPSKTSANPIRIPAATRAAPYRLEIDQCGAGAGRRNGAPQCGNQAAVAVPTPRDNPDNAELQARADPLRGKSEE